MKKYYTTFIFMPKTGVSNPRIMIYTIPECKEFSLTEVVFKTYIL